MGRLDRLLRLVRAARDLAADDGDERLLRTCVEERLISESQADEVRAELLEAELSGRPATAADLLHRRGLAPKARERRLGRYIVRREIARGGMATVYEAEDPELRRRIALKVLHDDRVSASLVKRLHREASIAAQLRHPNIVTIHDVGTARDEADPDRAIHYIAMDFVEGRTLADVMGERKTSRAELLRMLEDAARAVAYAHSKEVVHRDLKPANVLVEAGGRIVLSDFGLARAAEFDTQLTLSHDVLGTPHYMSPEQVRGRARDADARADVWALGVMLYEIVTGHRPFLGLTPREIFERILQDEPAALGRSDPLDVVCQKAIEKDPDRRYPSAVEFADDLARVRRGEPILARPASALYRLRKRLLRHKALAALVVLAIVAAVALAVQSWRAASREAGLRRLAMLWTTIIERKRDLRMGKVDPDAGRRRLEAAVRDVEAHTREWPREPQAYYVSARGKLYLGDLEGAERDVRAALSLRFDFRPGWTLLGIVKVEQYQRGGYSQKEEFERRLRELQPLLDGAFEAMAKGWPPGREEEEAERWGLAWTREDDVMRRIAQALRLHYVEDRTAEARALLEEGLRTYSAEEFANLMADCVPREESLAWHARGVEWAPGYEKGRLDRGVRLGESGKLDDAIAEYGVVIRLNPRSWAAYYNRGNARIAKGDLAGAADDYTEVIRIDPALAQAWHNRGVARLKMGEHEAAVRDFGDAIRLNPLYASAWSNRALARSKMGDGDGAMADYAEALRLDPRDVYTYYNRGALRCGAGDRDGAIADCAEALRIDPGFADAFLLQAKAHAEGGDLAAAVADLDAALRIRPRWPAAYLNRGRLRRAAGDREGAAADLRAALACAPPDWPDRSEVEELLKQP